ncbi:MAG: hypothetical protein ACYC3W_11030 [Candidatus Nanopelagicales bacterium]
MNLRRLALYVTWISLAWAVLLTGLAAAGNEWVLDRVAGGRYAGTTMPVWMRVLYAIMTLLMLAVANLAYRYAGSDATHRQRNLGRLVMLVFSVSTIVNAMSPSRPERFNAIGAAVTVLGVGLLRRGPRSDRVDMRLRR